MACCPKNVARDSIFAGEIGAIISAACSIGLAFLFFFLQALLFKHYANFKNRVYLHENKN